MLSGLIRLSLEGTAVCDEGFDAEDIEADIILCTNALTCRTVALQVNVGSFYCLVLPTEKPSNQEIKQNYIDLMDLDFNALHDKCKLLLFRIGSW